MSIERTSLEARVTCHAALADIARLAVVEELALGDRSPSELQAVVGLSSNLMAHHLKVLEDSGLVARRRSDGDRRRTYLTLEQTAFAFLGEAASIPAERVVFVCSANSARSQLAAALWCQTSTIPAASSGTHPAEHIAAGAKAVADRRSLTLADTTPRLFTDVATPEDLVIAVCDNAFEELGTAVALHWSIPDPVVRGDDAAFDDAYDELDRRIAALSPRLIAS